eukprot:scpid23107/ scgid10081/ WD repeat-containing protein 24
MSRRSVRGQSSAPLVEKAKVQYPKHTVFSDMESPLNAVSTCKDGGKVVVAGRNVFKVMSITPSGFEEVHNLRVGRVNLNFSHTDVQWHPITDELLATAATNGAVVLWDLTRQSKNKQAHLFNDHKRTVNKVCFHTDGNGLLSGSQDGTIKSFDIRTPPKALQTFDCKTESVRDVQVNPHSAHHFAAALENGCVQIWDTRNPAQYESYITAHQGPVFTCDWHPQERHWLASAGRDKVIKVWDMRDRHSHLPPQEIHALHTIASVARIKWRPDNPYELASCALLLDFNIHVWDIRRPYIPFASFQEHKDVATGIVWQKEASYLVSGAKDNFLYLHHLDDAHRPTESAPPLGLALGCRGHVSLAVSDEIKRAHFSQTPIPPPPPQRPSYTQPAFFRHLTPAQIAAPSVASDLMMHLRQLPATPNDVSDLDWMDVFQVLAKGYKLDGLPLTQLFEHNMEVARKYSRVQEAQVWRILSLIYAPMDMASGSHHPGSFSICSESHAAVVPASSARSTIAPTPEAGATGGTIGRQTASPVEYAGSANESAMSDGAHNGRNSTSSHSDAEDNGSDTGHEYDVGPDLEELNNIASGGYLDEGTDDLTFGFADPIGSDDALRNLELPSEAFQPRDDIEDPGSPSYLSDNDDMLKESSELLTVGALHAAQRGSSVTPSLSALSDLQGVPPWDFSPVVSDMLHFYAYQGNVQLTVSILLVLGEKGKSLIDTTQQEQWYQAYVDLLSRYQLWTVSALVIRLCPLKAINQLNLESTAVATQCGICTKMVMKKGSSYCDNCHKVSSLCIVCHQAVRGVYAWCQGCGHGGHLEHMREWFQASSWCPTGCGHKCEFM